MNWDQVDAARSSVAGARETIRPANGFTVQEYAARYGISPNTAKCQLDRLVAKGCLCMQKVLIQTASGAGVRAMNVYTFKRNENSRRKETGGKL